MPQDIRATSLARSAVFIALDASGRAEQVERRISDAIIMGVLRNGEKLPSESQLAFQLGVAVVTAREALESLRRQGLVATKRGRDGGSFVTFTRELREQLLQDRIYSTSVIELRDLAVQYSAIAGMAAELAADRASDDDLRLLRASAELLDLSGETATRRGVTTFRLTLAGLSQSARLVREELRLQSELGPILWRRLREESEREKCRDELLEIVSALEQQDAEAARAASIRQIRHSTEWLVREKMLAENPPNPLSVSRVGDSDAH